MPDNVIPFGPRRAATRPTSTSLVALAESWKLSLESDGKSEHTVRLYLTAARMFVDFLTARGESIGVQDVTVDQVRAFLAREIERTSIASTAQHQRALSVMWTWLIAEGERTGGNPMAGIARMRPPRKAKTYLTDEQIRALLDTCAGNGFTARRDTALIRVLVDVGPRAAGLIGMRVAAADPRVNDVDLSGRRIRVRLKGGRELWLPLGRKAAAALDRYLRARAGHRYADSPWLWLGAQGRLSTSGLRQMLERRGTTAGILSVHPHRFRRTFAHSWLKNGGNTDDLMHLAGWTSYDMVREYTEDLAVDRAHEAHRRLSPGDQI